MNNAVSLYEMLDSNMSLPDSATSRNGVQFNPRADVWSYRDGGINVSLNFLSIENISSVLKEGVKHTLLWYAENMSPSHTANGFTRFSHFFKTISEDKQGLYEITDVHLMRYRTLLGKKNQWYLGNLSGFIKKWHALGLCGVSKKAVQFLNEVRLQGNEKGTAVLTMDADKGPFTSIELEAIQSSLNEAYTAHHVNTADYLLMWLFILLGQRPMQYAYLKVCDVIEERTQTASSTYVIKVPRVKQRGELPRASFKDRILIPQIGKLLVSYAQSVAESFKDKLDDISQTPLFPRMTEESVHTDNYLFYHRTSHAIRQRVKQVSSQIHVFSERTGKRLNITAVRFRRTVGTRAAEEGHGELIIAELLDHTDTQNVGVYVEATPDIVERIDKAIALRMAPLAQAFAGVLVDQSQKDQCSSDKNIVAPQQTNHFEPVGQCGQHGFCGFMAPIACYTCTNFRAWQDGPHEAILNDLIAERERLLDTTDQRIASVNDRTILAVAQVVQMCKVADATGGNDG